MHSDTVRVLRLASNFVHSLLDLIIVQNRSHFEIACIVMEGEPPKSPKVRYFRKLWKIQEKFTKNPRDVMFAARCS